MIRILALMCFVAFSFLSVSCSSGGDDEGSDTPGDEISCGGEDNVECDAGQYCRFPARTCGVNNTLGTCEDIPSECNSELASVCGCDGITYQNECRANRAGQSVFEFVGCNQLEQSEGELCGGPSEIRCESGLFCDFVDGSCGLGGTYGLCKQVAFQCSTDPSFVCGCDNITYTNKCFAEASAVSVQFIGTCA